MNIVYRTYDRNVSHGSLASWDKSLHYHSLSSEDEFIYSKLRMEVKEETSPLLKPHQVNPLTHSFAQQMFVARSSQFCQSFYPRGQNDTGTFQKLSVEPPSGAPVIVRSQPACSSHPTLSATPRGHSKWQLSKPICYIGSPSNPLS